MVSDESLIITDYQRPARFGDLMIDDDLIKNNEPNCTHLIPNGKKSFCSTTLFKFFVKLWPKNLNNFTIPSR